MTKYVAPWLAISLPIYLYGLFSSHQLATYIGAGLLAAPLIAPAVGAVSLIFFGVSAFVTEKTGSKILGAIVGAAVFLFASYYLFIDRDDT